MASNHNFDQEQQHQQHQEKSHSKPVNLAALITSIARRCAAQKQKPLFLVLLIPVCLWINGAASPHGWNRNYSDTSYTPRMLQLDNTNLVDTTRLVLQYDLKDMKHRQNMLMYWDNNGHIHPLKKPDDMKTRETCTGPEWQALYHPSCNEIHQVDLACHGTDIIANGAFRDVWKIPETSGGSYRALKTLRYLDKREFDLKNFDRHRRDAMVFDQLVTSPHVVDIYGHCANSALFDYCEGGTLLDFFETKPDKLRVLEVAHSVASSIADAHHLDREGRPTIAHTDIKPDQWLLGRDGNYRLGDFNRARFLMWDTQAKEVCPFRIGKNVGKWRSPEEYKYEDETEKVDIWSLGNVLYFLLTESLPLPTMNEDKAIEFVKAGGHPASREYMRGDGDAFVEAMAQAMTLCFEADPKKRSGARKIANVLRQGMLMWKVKHKSSAGTRN